MSILGDFLKKQTEIEMDFHKRQASGQSIESLYEVPTTYGLKIVGSESWKYINEGRTKGKMPPEGVILQWLKDKGVPTPKDMTQEEYADAINWKIKKEGLPNSGNGIKAKNLRITNQVASKNADKIKELAIQESKKRLNL